MAISYGTVKIFFGDDRKRFGFVIPEVDDDLGDVFFHYNDGGFVDKLLPGTSQMSFSRPLRCPRKGDRIAYEVSSKINRHGGLAASVWYYADEYDRAKEAAKRPMTLAEAQEFLANAVRNSCWDTMEGQMRVEWFIDGKQVAKGAFYLSSGVRYGFTVVLVTFIPGGGYKPTGAQGREAELLIDLGVPGRDSTKVGVL